MASMMGQPSYSSEPRCSNCYAMLDMADPSNHVCAHSTDFHSRSGPSIAQFPGPPRTMNGYRDPPLSGKLPKFAPPARIDPFAANEAFLAPASIGGDVRAASPFGQPPRTGSAASGRFRMPPRSATTPQFRERSTSPELRIQQDSAFPIFPTRRAVEEQSRKERQRSKSQSRSQSTDRSRHHRNGTSSTSASRSNSPAMPQSPYPRGFAPRKSSMSSQRSRGDGSPYAEAEPVPPLPVNIDQSRQASPVYERNPSPPIESQITSPLAAPPINASTDAEHASVQRQASQQSNHFKKPSVSAAIAPLDAIGSTRRTNQEIGLSLSRSHSATGYRPDSRMESPSSNLEVQSAAVESRPYPWGNEPSAPETTLSRTPLPTMAEHVEPAGLAQATLPTMADAPQDTAAHRPTLPTMPEHAELPAIERTELPGPATPMEGGVAEVSRDMLGDLPVMKPLAQHSLSASHRARESASSDGSAYSVAQSASSRSSPPTSASSFSLQNDLPRGENIDSVLSDIAEGTQPPSTQDAASPSKTSGPPIVPVPLQQRRRGPAKSFSRPNYTPPQLELPGATNQNMMARRSPPQFPSQSQSPLDHVTRQTSRSPGNISGQRSPGSDSRSPTGDLRTPPSSSPLSPRLPHMPRPIRPGDPYANVPPSPAGSMRRPTTPGFKGTCRGCGEMIMGKSVSSADGRLTGRYHKHCFVCRTCKEPFQTADFYVIDNHPYCHRHYHTLNESLCSVCDRGIEGPYMETDASKKFHPHCFTCKECHLILRHDYFEIDGAIYCEKHSKKNDLLGAGRRHPERRTTRLMMM